MNENQHEFTVPSHNISKNIRMNIMMTDQQLNDHSGSPQAGMVSTVIPVFNRSAMLREAVDSVLAQTYRPIEIVIVDDGSTDDTPRTYRELAEEHPEIIRCTRQENAGPGVARETGRLLAHGEFIQYLDSDDLLQPRKFERQVAALRANPDCGVAYCKTREYRLGEEPRDVASVQTGTKHEKLFPRLLSGRIWRTVTPLFRRTLCNRVGPWTDLRLEEDWEYDARVAALSTRLVWCDEFLVDFRHHDGPRASGGFLEDPERMRDRVRAHELIFKHARRAGIEAREPEMQHFSRELFLLARQCGFVGLAKESCRLFQLARVASGPQRSRGRDFRIYRMAAGVLGWSTVGRLACWIDQWRLAEH